MNDRAKGACEKIEREVTLLVGLLYHCQLSPLEYHKAILEDGLKRAHAIYNIARRGNGRKPLK